MPDTTVDIPAIGKVDQKWLYAGLALIVGIVGYAYLRARRSSVTSEATSPDAFQGAQLPIGSYDAYGNLLHSAGSSVEPTNWTLKATDYLTNLYGYTPVAVGLALSHYLSGQELTQDEADIVNLAKNAVGNPPQDLPIRIRMPNPNPTTPTSVANLWDTWQNQQIASGAYVGKPGFLDWGVIARNTFAGSPTREEVYYRALALQQQYPDLHSKYAMYVPTSVVSTIHYQGT